MGKRPKKELGYGKKNHKYPHISQMEENTFRLRVRQNKNIVYGEEGASQAFIFSFVGKRSGTEKPGVPQAVH